ncbi:heavy metal translocating P-type ATPase [Corynebacterium uberis]|uniref:heavy metal translocating P-type ATPase n=1 Tax=Corynebacterium TaxID=1716 RepID=UPI001D0A2BB2|nr:MULTISPECIES: heavy metal translocating P-type ATPase [Corynebacterium]MCZ9310341.1 cadmium-translocating P-type ATPase [Corynebacterium sp. c6VSa_13]UDL74788.1 cadmium-translocating P-type ATPase [Corynebacterium uberis]UDL77023.1 cadmium-translocating P-type ATPase [Corynebacterium uberis]UDL79234.1 cadmium-translocating P-type ATPase [Corynebacterium uberis]UDL81439.1 cadmium-translocating P-type ATPase [Corynebacterium uberis]
MTCTSCSARVERKLNKLDGVTATVNFATETADITVAPSPDGPDAGALIDVVRATGYDAYALAGPSEPAAAGTATTAADAPSAGTGGVDKQHADPLTQRLIVCALLAAPVLVISMIPALQFRHWQWLVFALASPVFFWGGWPFHRAAAINLRHGAFTMDTLISLGTTAAYVWSCVALFWGNAGEPGMVMHMSLSAHAAAGMDEIYLESVAVVITFLLLGRWFERRAKSRSSAALRALLDLGAKEASVIRADREVRVPIGQLEVGDIAVVRPGEKIPSDGTVTDGHSAIDESLLTGESVPVDVSPGATVTGATLNTSGRLLVRIDRIGEATTLAQLGRLVTAAQAGKAPVQRLADRISQYFVPAVMLIAAATLGAHLWAGSATADAFAAAVAVLIIACPCALGLATPTALLVGTGRGAQLGLVIRGPEVLESTRRANTVVMDKTGTITTGVMELTGITPLIDAPAPTDLLALAAAAEQGSEHPIGRAIVTAATDTATDAGAPLLEATAFSATAGQGVRATVDGHDISVTRPPADWDHPALRAATDRGETAVLLRIDAADAALLTISDTVKDTSRAGVDTLRALGLEPYLLTGDNPGAARSVAAHVGIDPSHVIAQATPESKVAHITALQDQGKRVAMIGDGVNDAAALAAADLGLAMGAGSDVAIEASDITLMHNDLRCAGDAIALSRRTLRTIRGNLFWAFAYNVALIPVAAAGLLNPMFAGIAMAASSVFVVSNSLRLRTFRGTTGTGAAATAA